MKKSSNLMRAGGGLLVLTLITSSFVGGTFAKYVTDGKAEDSARVAKWGVDVTVTGGGFKTQYDKDDHTSKVSGPTVQGNGSESITFVWDSTSSTKKDVSNVIAPGTQGTFGGVEITGRPEVAVKVDTVADVSVTGWEVNEGEFYCPLVFTIGDQTICGLHYSKGTAGGKASFEAAIKKAIQDATTQYVEAGTDLSTVGADVQYEWAWPFENKKHENCDKMSSEDSKSYHVQDQTDELDTVLGDNATGEGGAQIPGVMIKVTTTVTQVD